MIKDKIRRFLKRLREPVIVNRGIDIVAGVSWLLLGIFGLFYSFAEFNTVHEFTPEMYSSFWGLAIGTLGTFAGIAAFSTLWPASVRLRILKEQTELILLSLLGGLVAVYPVAKFITLFLPPFDLTEVAGLAVSLDFMVLPTWRIIHLTQRVRALRKAASELGVK